jgi:hypothetical protein
MSLVPNKPAGTTAHVQHHRKLHERVFQGDGLVRGGRGVNISVNDHGEYVIDVNVPKPIPAVTTKMFKVQDDLGASLSCFSWDGTTAGTSPIYVAKKASIQNLVTSVEQNLITYTFSYLSILDTNTLTPIHYVTRTVSGSDGSFESDVITPPFLFNDVIMAISIKSVTLDSNACVWQEMTGREWGQI